MINLLNLSPGERVDLADFSFVAQDSLLGAARGVSEGLLTSPAKQTLWIIRGFQMSNPSGQILQVTKGSAILALRQGTRITQGVLTADGADVSSLDLSSYTGGTYNVYIRFVLTPGSFDTRTFFRASGGGAEYAQSVPTRITGDWELAVAPAIPGAEWVQIGTVTTPSMATTDMRPLYFEGRVDQATASGWGTAADRTPGNLGDLQTALAAVRQCLEDIKGPGLARWYSPFVAGQTIGYAGTPVAGRTTWADDNFYAQGDSARPNITFGSDAAHIAYVRASGLMVATGPELGAAAQSVGSSLSFRSGVDNALVRGGFYRATAGAGSAGIDGSLTRGPAGTATGGLGLYGAQGLMGAAGVGLGYTLGSQAPALFVNATNVVGIGHTSATTLSPDPTLPLQLTTANGQSRSIGLNDGAAVQVVFGMANNAQVVTGNATYYGGVIGMPRGAPLLFTQASIDYGQLKAGAWMFGRGSQTSQLTSATVNVVDSPVSIASTGVNQLFGSYTTYNQTSALLLNNNGVTSTLYGVQQSTRLTFAVGNYPVFNIDASGSVFAVRDLVNTLDVISYSPTTKIASFANQIKAPVVASTTQNGFQFNPANSHQNTLPGCALGVRAGTTIGTNQSVSKSMGELQVACAYPYGTTNGGQIIEVCWPVRAMVNQQWNACSVVFYLGDSAFDSNVIMTLGRYNSLSEGASVTPSDAVIYTTTANYGSHSSGLKTLSWGGNAETSVAYNDWYINLYVQSGGNDLQVCFKYANLQFSTSSYNPQMQ